jgi:hypothetical protein
MRTGKAKAAVGQTPPGTKILTLFSYSLTCLVPFRFVSFHFVTRNRPFRVTRNFAN